MPGTAAARRYAKALLSIAQESNEEEAIGAELSQIANILAEPNLAQTLALPNLPPKVRRSIVEQLITAASPKPVVANFLRVLAENDRLSVFADIDIGYQTLLEKLFGRVRATIKSSAELSEQELKSLVDAFSQMTQKTVIPTVKVDPDLLGGVTVEIEGRVYDASLKTQLRRVSEALAQQL